MRASGRAVLSSSPARVVCDIAVKENAICNVRVSVAACCTKEIDICIAQSAAKTIRFTDAETADYSGATEITFDVWERSIEGASLLSVSLTGGDISLIADNQFQFTIDNATSQALAAGTHYCEAWVTLSSGARRLVGQGKFKVEDTRKHD